MNNPTNRALVEAAAWRAHLSEANLETTPEFEAWLETDAIHPQAWAQVNGSWNILHEHATSPEVLILRRAALADAHAVAQQRWTSSDSDDDRSVRQPRLVKRWSFVMAMAATLLIGAFAWYFATPDIYRTKVGERRLVALADGSKVQLDSATELSVHYATRARNLTLSRGQARFDVAHDAERPFVVTAGSKKIVATGTAFNIDVLGPRVLVTLIEGRVVVLPESLTDLSQAIAASTQYRLDKGPDPKAGTATVDGAVRLEAGQELIVSEDGDSRVYNANIERVSAWQKGQLLFDDEPLKLVVERMNRYSTKPIVLTDPSIRDLRISGVFDANDAPAFVATITQYLPLHANVRQNGIELSRR